MRSLFNSLLFIAVAILAAHQPCRTQKPSYDVTILADGKPLEPSQGISSSTKTLKLTAQLTPESQQQYPQLQPTVLINRAILNLIRDTRRVGFIDWPGDSSIARLFNEAKAGDRFIVQFEEVALQTKQGVTQKMDNLKIIQISVKK